MAELKGRDAAKATADRLKEESQKEAAAKNAEQITKPVGKEEIERSVEIAELAVATLPESTIAFFKKNAAVGLEEDRPRLPFLMKVTEANSNNELVDGKLAAPGTFFYSPELSDMGSEVAVSIALVGKKFHTKVEPSEADRAKGVGPKAKFTQMVAGYFLSNNKPFIMFATGKRLSRMWAFVEAIRPFTKHKDCPVPMFAFKVQLKTVREKNDYGGASHIVEYNLMRNTTGQIQILTDQHLLEIYAKGVPKFEQIIEGFISHNAVDPQTLELLSERAVPIDVTPVEDAPYQPASVASTAAPADDNNINVEDIPF